MTTEQSYQLQVIRVSPIESNICSLPDTKGTHIHWVNMVITPIHPAEITLCLPFLWYVSGGFPPPVQHRVGCRPDGLPSLWFQSLKVTEPIHSRGVKQSAFIRETVERWGFEINWGNVIVANSPASGWVLARLALTDLGLLTGFFLF